MSTNAKRPLSVHEYLALEADSPTKHEFYRGQIFAMPGVSIPHNQLTGNLIGFLYAALRGKNCRPYGSDLRLSIRAVGLYTYPDVMVICGPVERDADDKNSVTNPRLVVEVLSKDNKRHDVVLKRHDYARAGIPQYWIVDPDGRTLTVLGDIGPSGYAELGVVQPGERWASGHPFPLRLDPAEFC